MKKRRMKKMRKVSGGAVSFGGDVKTNGTVKVDDTSYSRNVDARQSHDSNKVRRTGISIEATIPGM